jgi:predicted lipoprotein
MTTRLTRLALAALAWTGLAAGTPASAASPAFDSVTLIETWLLPRYDALVAATGAQSDAWTGFCAKPDSAGIPALKTAFAKAADSWTAVEFVTFGPASQDLRPDRFSFFPDRRNAIARAMAEVLADPDTARFAPERFAKSSAAAQGFPALERLLFEEGAAAQLAAGPEAARRCTYASAIALNLATMAKEIRTAWGDRNTGVLAAVVSGKGDQALFPDVGAIPGMILTDLSGAYQRVTDTKILPVLGPNPDGAKPTMADGWRAGRSGQVVKVMIQSADALLQDVAKQMPSRPQWVVNKAATAADKSATEFPTDLGAAAQSAESANKILADIKVFKAAQLTVYRPIASYFGISLGFNALDGD